MECLVSSNQAIEQEQLVVENKIENKVEENSLLVKETIAQGDTNISKFAEEHPKNEDASNSNNKNPKSDNAESPRKDKDTTLQNSQQSETYSTVKLEQDVDSNPTIRKRENMKIVKKISWHKSFSKKKQGSFIDIFIERNRVGRSIGNGFSGDILTTDRDEMLALQERH